MEEIKTYEVRNGWLMDFLEGWNYANLNRFKNWVAIVTRSGSKDYNYQFLEMANPKDEEYCSVEGISVGDVICAGHKDYKKGYGVKQYYKVLSKTEDSITLYGNTTFLRAFNYTNKE